MLRLFGIVLFVLMIAGQLDLASAPKKGNVKWGNSEIIIQTTGGPVKCTRQPTIQEWAATYHCNTH